LKIRRKKLKIENILKKSEKFRKIQKFEEKK